MSDIFNSGSNPLIGGLPAEFVDPTPPDYIPPSFQTLIPLAPDPSPDLSSPILRRLPSALTNFQGKYGPNNPLQSSLPSSLYNALAAYDQARVQKGKSPLNESQTASVINTMQTGKQTTPEAQKNVVEAGISDLTTLLQSIPRLPAAALGELQKLPQLPAELNRVQSQYSGAEALGETLKLPGINLIPGSYVASNILTGEAGELAQHPLFAALDVLPYAGKAAKGTKVAQAAIEESTAASARLSEQLGVPLSIRPPNPIASVLTKKLGAEGVEPNLLGNLTQPIGEAFSKTKPGQVVKQAFGQDSRNLMRRVNQADQDLYNAAYGKGDTNLDSEWSGVVRRASQLNDEFSDIPFDRRIELAQRMQSPIDEATGTPLKPSDYASTDRELSYISTIQDLNAETSLLQRNSGELYNKFVAGGDELYTPEQYNRLQRHEKRVTDYEANYNTKQNRIQYKQNILDPDTPPVSVYSSRLDTHIPSNNLTDTIDSLRELRRTDPAARTVVSMFDRGSYSDAASQLRNLKGAKWDDIVPNRQEAADILLDLKKTDNDITKLRSFTERGLASRKARYEIVQRKVVPGRWDSAIQSEFKNRLGEWVSTKFPSAPQLDNYLRYVAEGNYQSLLNDRGVQELANNLGRGGIESEFRNLQREVRQTWMDMKEKGVDPVYMHRVNPQDAAMLQYPHITDRITTPSSIRARTFDMSPSVGDAQVALTHQGMEFLRREAAQKFFDDFTGAYGVRQADLRDRYISLAQAENAKNPFLSVDAIAEKLMKKDGWTPLDVNAFMPWRKKTANLSTMDMPWVPSVLSDNLHRMFDPQMGKLTAVLDPVMKVFRTSLLPLSPRWHIYNILGGAIMVGAETSPIELMRFAGRAREMASSGKLHEIPGAPPKGFFGMPEEAATEWMKNADGASKVGAVHSFAAGNKLRELWDSAQSTRARGAFNNVVQKSYDINGWFDDFYRSIAYLSGEDKALTKGLTAEAAQKEGINLVRKVMQNWDEITPIERNILRFAFPFYGWMKHVLGYVYHYPFDHPVRTSVMASFARNELADMGESLPTDMLNLFFIGDQDENGNIKAVNMRGLNPFSDVSNYFTLSGLLGNVNPIVGAAAQSLGVDVSNGGPQLYPEVSYNPETGKLEGGGKNPVGSFASSVFPAGRAISQLLFNTDNFRTLLATNPDAAGRMLQSEIGLPVLLRNVNVPQEQIRAEVNRQDVQSQVLGEALRSGDLTPTKKYPGLQAYVNQIIQLQSQGQTAQYELPAQLRGQTGSLFDQVYQGVAASYGGSGVSDLKKAQMAQLLTLQR